jgi:hypothetical protein
VPSFWSSALVVCLGLVGAQSVLALTAELVRK